MRIKPFKGYRPPKELVEEVSSRPYDVLNSEEARQEAKGNEKSLYHIIKPEINFAPGTDEHDPRVYDAAVEQFRLFKKNGWLVQDASDKYYVYAQTILASNPLSGGKDKTQFGLVVGAWVDDYLEGHIKKHELTRRVHMRERCLTLFLYKEPCTHVVNRCKMHIALPTDIACILHCVTYQSLDTLNIKHSTLAVCSWLG